jgi:hypothetical protein
MAVEQSGAEAKPDPTPDTPTVQSAEPADATGQADKSRAQADFDELKRKFREALDRKRGTRASAEGAHDTGKVHGGSHGPAVSRRSFRRKSGG